MTPAHTLMIQGTSSSAGKSLLAAALCRIYARRGLRVAPFKSQNMSNNAAVCADGGEIGRAQALQAIAAGIEPSVDMNPILLKPEADSHSQVVVLGRPWSSLPARQYYLHKKELWAEATAALDRLRRANDLVIIEGAGSPVELNLKQGDIVNMSVALYSQAPVLLVGDIDRGGIFAQLLGTLWLLEPEERNLVRGLLVNKFRGDLGLFEDGIRLLEEKALVPVLGVIPYLHGLNLPEEDAAGLTTNEGNQRAALCDIAVVHLPHIANFDDFDPLGAESGIRLRYIDSPRQLGQPAAVIIPGTKSTIADLLWLRQGGLEKAIQEYVHRGGKVVGICGGYQMLGTAIRDPQHVESAIEQVPGLGLLALETIFEKSKNTHLARLRALGGPGWLRDLNDAFLQGYEIHMGVTPSAAPLFEIVERSGKPVQTFDGACNSDGHVWGCYIHGLFTNDNLRRAWLKSLGWQAQEPLAESGRFTQALDTLATQVAAALDLKRLDDIIWGKENGDIEENKQG